MGYSAFGISIPAPIFGACLVLLALFVIALAKLFWDGSRVTGACKRFADIFQGLPDIPVAERRNGLALARFNSLEEKAQRLGADRVRTWWLRLAENVVRLKASGRSTDSMFLAQSPREVLPEERTLGPLYHSSLHHAIPGLLTSLGLAATFLAILWGLKDVRPTGNPQKPYDGIDELILSLSGKFVSSVVALTLAIVYTLIEKLVERQTFGHFEDVLDRVGAVLPVLSGTQVLIDIQDETAKQSRSLSNISSDIVDRFVNVFRNDLSPNLTSGLSTEMVAQLQPTLSRMNEALDGLVVAIQRLEQHKQESIATELRGLLETLQRSITESLGQMGDQFRSALTGAARDEFGSVQGTLKGTADLLQGMNQRFAELQASLGTVIQQAENSTRSQLETGEEQTRAMIDLMKGLMTQLQQSSQESLGAMSARLTVVVDDLSSRVSGLSERMIEATQNATNSSQASAERVIARADKWTTDSATRLEELLKSIETRSGEFQNAGQVLSRAEISLTQTLQRNERALQALQEASTSVSAYSAALVGQSGELKKLGEQHLKIVTVLADVTSSLKSGMDSHQGLLRLHGDVLGRYDGSFEKLEGRLDAVLKVVLKGLQNYSEASEANFRAIVQMVNETVPQITNVLNSQTAELQDKLEELNDVLEKGVARLREPERP